MRQSYRLIWNSMIIWIMRVFRLLPEIFLIPFIIHRLGEDSYGIFILAWSVFPILNLIQSGIGSALVKYSAEYFEKKQMDEVNNLLSSSCMLSAVWGLLGGVFILVAVNLFPQWLTMVSPERTDDLRFACNAMALMTIVVFPLMPFAGILHALQRYDIFSLVNTVFAYIRIGLIVGWFLVVEQSLRAVIVISAISLVATNLVFMVLAFRKIPFLSVHLSFCNRRSVRVIFSFGVMVLLTSICILINTSGVNWLMGILVSPAFVGVMAVMLKPSQLIREIIQGMSVSVMPATSKYTALQNNEVLSELFIRSSRYIVLVVVSSLIFVCCMTRPILGLWMGPDYQYLTVYVCVSCMGMGIWMSTSSAGHMLNGLGKLKMSLITIFTGSVAVSITTIVAIYILFDSPYWAVSVGLLSGYATTALLRLAYFVKFLRIEWRFMFWRIYGQALMLVIPILLIVVAILHYFHIDGFVIRLLVSCLAFSVFTVIFVIFFLTKDEKKLTKTIFESIQIKLFKNKKIIVKG